MRIPKTVKNLFVALAVGVALFGATVAAMADKLYLKDGRVLDGTLVKQDSAFVVFKVNGKEEIFDAAEVVKVEKTDAAKPETAKPAAAPAPAAATTPAKPADAPKADADAKKPEGDKSPAATGAATRVAIIPFGPPQAWKNDKKLAGVETLVGGEICTKPWREILPLLKKDKVDVVVVKINSGGGMLNEMVRFPEVFREYKKNFRMVCWVESSISAAAMSPWVISEFYLKPDGHIGGCTGFNGGTGVAIKGFELLKMLDQMKDLSIEAGRDPLIMRAMQIQQPLSANVDENGTVTFFGDSTSGKVVVNPDGHVLTLNSDMAMKIKFAQGIAANEGELAKVMGLKEYEIAGKDATKYMEDFMLAAHKAQVFFVDTATKYILARNAAQQLANSPNDPRFGSELGKARQALAEMKRQVELNPNFPMLLGQQVGELLDNEWFDEQEKILKELVRRSREAEEQRRRNR